MIKKTLLELYNTATAEPCSFSYVSLRAKDEGDMFYMNFDRTLTVDWTP